MAYYLNVKQNPLFLSPRIRVCFRQGPKIKCHCERSAAIPIIYHLSFILNHLYGRDPDTYKALFWSFFCPFCVFLRIFVAILSKMKRFFSNFTNADNVSNLDKLRKPNAQARLEYGCEFV